MDEPSELSLKEIHAHFLKNNYKVTNTQLVKHFRRFLTGSDLSELTNSSNNRKSVLIRLTHIAIALELLD